MINKGLYHIHDVLDILNLIQTKKRLEILENFVFKNPLQKKVSRMNAENYLGTDTFSSDCSISSEDFERIKGYKISTDLDLYLFKTIYNE
jgi:hypothetical protein